MKYFLFFLICFIALSGCVNKMQRNTQKTDEDTAFISYEDGGIHGGRMIRNSAGDFYYINSVRGHDEQDTIIGNFTGQGIDTLYVETVDLDECLDNISVDNDTIVKYFMTSPNPQLGKVELLGYYGLAPKLVNEGDLDGNGTCEVGYLPVWRLSQWRVYHLFSFHNGKWTYLIDPDFEIKDSLESIYIFETGYLLRGSGKQIAEPSGRRGWVKINYQTQGVGQTIKDTLVCPNFSNIY